MVFILWLLSHSKLIWKKLSSLFRDRRVYDKIKKRNVYSHKNNAADKKFSSILILIKLLFINRHH